MKSISQADLFLMLGTAAALWMILKTVKAKAATPAPQISKEGQQYTSIVAQDNGWQYFSDGTAIGPDGAYYYQGKKVYGGAGSTVYAEEGMFGLTAAGAASGWD